MLTKEELRIGNYIIGKDVNGHRDINQRVLELSQDGIAVSPFSVVATGRGFELVQETGTDRPLLYGWAKGIPIDTNWLKEFGFTAGPHEYGDFSKSGFSFKFQVGQCYFVVDQNKISRPLKFIHELQNLFADLSGELLELPDGKTKPS